MNLYVFRSTAKSFLPYRWFYIIFIPHVKDIISKDHAGNPSAICTRHSPLSFIHNFRSQSSPTDFQSQSSVTTLCKIIIHNHQSETSFTILIHLSLSFPIGLFTPPQQPLSVILFSVILFYHFLFPLYYLSFKSQRTTISTVRFHISSPKRLKSVTISSSSFYSPLQSLNYRVR